MLHLCGPVGDVFSLKETVRIRRKGTGAFRMECPHLFVFVVDTDERYDPEPKSKWDEEWDKNKSAFPFSDKLGELSDKIGSTIDDTISKFRRKDREDSPERCRWAASPPLA